MEHRRLAPLVVAALALMSLTACSSAAEEPEAPETGGGSEGGEVSGELSFLSPWTKVQTEPLIAAFEESHEGTTVNVTYVAGNENAQQLLSTQLSAGNAPDVLYLNPGAGSPTSVGVLAENGYLADLSDAPWADQLEEPYRSFLSYEDKVYGFPSTAFGIGAIYNQTAMEAAGLTPPTTWSEVLDFCADAQDAGLPAYVLGANMAWISQLIPYALASTLVDSKDPEFEAGVGTENDFTDSEWVTVMEKYGEMIDAGCFQQNPTGTDGPASYVMLGKGEALAAVQVGALLSEIQKNAEEGTVFEMVPLPATDDPDETTLPASLSSTMGVNADAKNPELAMAFVNWMSEVEQLSMLAELQAGAVPTIGAENFEAPVEVAVFQQFQAEGRTTPAPDVSWPNPEVQAALQAGAQGMLVGSSTAESVTADMQAAAQK
ncbi:MULTISPECIES: ABC transporter substrate-binding protein [unclassified Actinotalea]|uniref:ABC transporter substrate-binding protein n=1 Tax=unclassified Actinotalea TaxID=2638618 RepID=UPI0015F54581|nr:MULTISPECIES: ABC transporter substrate-binding protein [unclassified Actinotalea]